MTGIIDPSIIVIPPDAGLEEAIIAGVLSYRVVTTDPFVAYTPQQLTTKLLEARMLSNLPTTPISGADISVGTTCTACYLTPGSNYSCPNNICPLNLN